MGRALGQVEESDRLLRLLQDVTVLANEANSVREAMTVFLDTIRDFTGWQIGHALVLATEDNRDDQEPGEALVSSSIWSVDETQDYANVFQARQDFRLHYGDSLAGSAWQKGAPILVEDISTHAVVGREALLQEHLNAAVAIPVFTGRQVAAVLEFFFEDASAVSTGLLEVLANAGIKLGRVIERRQAEAQLRLSQAQLKEAQKLAHLGTWVWDIAKDKVSWSEELYRIFDLDEDRFGATFQAFLNRVHPDDKEIVKAKIQRAYETGAPFFFQNRIVRDSGEERILLVRGEVELDPDGHHARMAGTAQDITDFVAIEDQLQAQNQLLDNVLAQGNVVIWVMDLEGNQRLVRRGGLATLGIPLGDRMDVNVFDTIAETHPLAGFLRQALSGAVIDVDFMVGDRTYDLRILPRRDQQGEINGVSGIAFDITQRKDIEQDLHEREQSYRQLVDNIKEYAIYSLDVEGNVTHWNESARRLIGYQAEEIIGKHISIFYTPEACQHGLVDRALQIAREKGRYESEGLRVRKDGSQFWANVVVAPILDIENELVGYTKVVRDFSERRAFELALKESESKFRSIFEYAAIGLALLDLKGNFLLANAPLRKLLGVEVQAVPALNLKPIIFEIDFKTLMERFSDTTTGSPSLFRRESRIRRPDGRIVWTSLTFSLVRDSDNNPLSMIAMFEDINDRKRMEAELREIKRQIILSQEAQRTHLAQELHDDPMQELYGVLYQLDLENDSLTTDELIPQIQLAKESVELVIHKLRVICGQLRPQSLAPFGLEGAIREYMAKFQEDYPDLRVQLSLNYDGQLLSEEVRISLFRILQQALGNIIRHAQAENVTVRFNYDDCRVFLEVEDDGIGFEVPSSWIDFARQDHLGLAGASERAELLGGKLNVQSNPGQGTLTRVEIPLHIEKDPALDED